MPKNGFRVFRIKKIVPIANNTYFKGLKFENLMRIFITIYTGASSLRSIKTQ